jgi:hypothetical protein
MLHVLFANLSPWVTSNPIYGPLYLPNSSYHDPWWRRISPPIHNREESVGAHETHDSYAVDDHRKATWRLGGTHRCTPNSRQGTGADLAWWKSEVRVWSVSCSGQAMSSHIFQTLPQEGETPWTVAVFLSSQEAGEHITERGYDGNNMPTSTYNFPTLRRLNIIKLYFGIGTAN